MTNSTNINHADAIAALLIADLTDTRTARVRRIMNSGYALFNLHSALSRTERRDAFAHGDVVRETMSTRAAGHGYALPPVRRLNANDRAAIVDALIDAGFDATLTRTASGYLVTFACDD